MKFYILINDQEQMVEDSELTALWSAVIAANFNNDAVLVFDESVRQKFGPSAKMIGSES